MSNSESEALLQRVLDFLQRDRRLRYAIGLAFVGALVAYGASSLYHLLPRHYTLTISGGDIVNNRHFLARILQSEAEKRDLTLVVQPISGSIAAMEALSTGKIDVALVQGGLEKKWPNVEHVATVAPEMVHLLVRPPIASLADLRGKTINMGAKGAGSREVALTLTRFAGLVEDVDYVETSYSPEQLLALPAHKMPDAILTVSSVPSYLVELLVRKHHYQILEIPFPEALALRHGWAADGKILAYTYDLDPPVPGKDLVTVAVNMHLLAHAKVDPEAIQRLLEVLYSPSVSARLLAPIDEARIKVASGYPLSAGLTAYLERNDSLLTLDNWNKAQGLFGLVMSFAGMGLVLLKWFRGPEPKPNYDDAKLHKYLVEAAAIERKHLEGAAEEPAALEKERRRLATMHLELLESYPSLTLKDPSLFDRCVAALDGARRRVDETAVRPGAHEVSA